MNARNRHPLQQAIHRLTGLTLVLSWVISPWTDASSWADDYFHGVEGSYNAHGMQNSLGGSSDLKIGTDGGIEHRGYFAFNTSTFQSIESAILRINGWTVADDDDALGDLVLYEVVTPTTQLITSSNSLAIFDDLGTGQIFGSGRRLPRDSQYAYEIALNDAGISALRASASGNMAIGLRMEPLTGAQRSYIGGYPHILTAPVPGIAQSPQHYLVETARHPLQSAVDVELFVGDPDNGGIRVASFADVPVQGKADVQMTLDPSGEGVMKINYTDLRFDAPQRFFSLAGIGSFRAEIDDLRLRIESSFTPVESNEFVAADGSPSFLIEAFEGEIRIENPTLTIKNWLGSIDPFTIGSGGGTNIILFEALGPVGLARTSGYLDVGPNGLDPNQAEFQLRLANVPIHLADFNGLPFYLRLNGDVFLAVPEPSSMTLAAIGLMATIGLVAQRRARRRVA